MKADSVNKNVCLINLLYEHGYKLPEPHEEECRCDVCNGNRFGHIKGQMAALKALCNPVWISVSSEDPFETIFKLQSMDVKFERVSGSFAMEFEELFKKTEQFFSVKHDASNVQIIHFNFTPPPHFVKLPFSSKFSPPNVLNLNFLLKY